MASTFEPWATAIVARAILCDVLRVMLVAASALALLASIKFLYLLVEGDFDITQAPVVFLVPVAALTVGVLLAARGRNSGIFVIAVVSLVLLAFFVSAIVRRGLEQQNWADALLVFAGLPVAAVVLLVTPRVLRDRQNAVK